MIGCFNVNKYKIIRQPTLLKSLIKLNLTKYYQNSRRYFNENIRHIPVLGGHAEFLGIKIWPFKGQHSFYGHSHFPMGKYIGVDLHLKLNHQSSFKPNFNVNILSMGSSGVCTIVLLKKNCNIQRVIHHFVSRFSILQLLHITIITPYISNCLFSEIFSMFLSLRGHSTTIMAKNLAQGCQPASLDSILFLPTINFNVFWSNCPISRKLLIVGQFY